MDDTTPGIRRYVRERYSHMSGAERVLIGAQMFETARTLVLASLPPGLPEPERQRRLCERFYGTLAEKVFAR